MKNPANDIYIQVENREVPTSRLEAGTTLVHFHNYSGMSLITNQNL